MRYHGQMSLQIAILVAFTQLIPEHQVQVFGVLKARVKVCPSFASKTDGLTILSCRLYPWHISLFRPCCALWACNALGSSYNLGGL